MTTLDRFKSLLATAEAAGVTRVEVARDLNIGETLLSHIVGGRRTPSGKVAARIERWSTSRGEPIMAADWYPDEAAA